MEIYYCQVCGKKIDGDALQSGDAVRRGSDQAFCRGCLSKASAVPPPARPGTSGSRVPRVYARPAERVSVRAPAQPQISTKTFAMIVLGLGAATLLLGAFSALKKDEPVKKTETSAPPAVSPAPVAQKKTAPALETQPPSTTTAQVSPEQAADSAYRELLKNAASRSPEAHIEALEKFLKQYPAELVSARARVELTRAKKLQKVLADGVLAIGTMEPDESWGFHNGSEFGPAKGGMEWDQNKPKEGVQSMKLSADFTPGGAYVCISRDIVTGTAADVLPVLAQSQVKSLRLWVKSPVAKNIGLRIKDAREQTHQQDVEFQPSPDWQMIEVKSFTSGVRYNHWGGVNDGVFHWPIRGLAIMLTKGGLGDKPSAEIWLDQVELVVEKLSK
ncbi:MAG TPA: hypothetical protein VEK08_23350 [Planctomycetota bacterium]|nr:hypothetical protein [Planctomycetota bacterium]